MTEIELKERPIGDRLTMLSTQAALQQAQLDRIEAKLDRLLAALAEDDQDEEPGVDLQGDPLPKPRDLGEPL